MIQNQIGRCLAERIIQAHNKNEDFKIYIVIPSVPGVNGILENNTAQEKFIDVIIELNHLQWKVTQQIYMYKLSLHYSDRRSILISIVLINGKSLRK